MRVLICSSCGLATSKEFASCPVCRRKDLQVRDSFNTSATPYDLIYGRKTAAGASSAVSYMTVAILATGLTAILYLCVYPLH